MPAWSTSSRSRSPVLFGSGVGLFEGVDSGRVALEQGFAEPTQRVTHVTYAVRGAVTVTAQPGSVAARRLRLHNDLTAR